MGIRVGSMFRFYGKRKKKDQGAVSNVRQGINLSLRVFKMSAQPCLQCLSVQSSKGKWGRLGTKCISEV